MNIFVLYHFGGSKRNLSYDCLLRLKATSLFAATHDVSNIFFVGGEFANYPSGAEEMCEYYKKNSTFSLPSLHTLGSFTTESNILAIIEATENFFSKDLNVVITNEYHARRIEDLIYEHADNLEVFGAEDIINEYGDESLKRETQKYVNSLEYKIKTYEEFVLRMIGKSFICQKILKFVRGLSYKQKI